MTHIIDVIENTREGAEDFAMDIAKCDADFIGDNGNEYLWEDASEFETNAEYAWSIAEKEDTVPEMLEKFVDVWMETDSYYGDYSLKCVEVGNDLLCVSFVFEEND